MSSFSALERQAISAFGPPSMSCRRFSNAALSALCICCEERDSRITRSVLTKAIL